MNSYQSKLSEIATPNGIADHVQKTLQISMVLVTQPLEQIERVLASAGQPLPEEFRQSFPIEYSICRYISDMDFALIVDDVFSHPLLHNHPAVSELGVAAYLGVPVERAGGGDHNFVLCALNNHQHRWTPEDIDLMQRAATRLSEMDEALF